MSTIKDSLLGSVLKDLRQTQKKKKRRRRNKKLDGSK